MKEIELRRSSVIFDEQQHRYFLNGEELQGVTSTLLRRAFPDKYKDIDPAVLANAAAKGHALHVAIELYDSFGQNATGDERITAYEQLKATRGLTTLENEYLVSDGEHYASSIDIVMQDQNGDICLVDVKSTYTLDKQSTGLQLSIYKRFFEQQNPRLKVEHIYALWMPNRDHSICELHELSVVDSETIDALIEADLNDEPFEFELIPGEWLNLERDYQHWSKVKQEAEEHLDSIKESMLSTMQNANLSAVRTDAMTVTYIPAKTTRRFDSARFRKENTELYDTYMKDVESAPQVRVLPKNNNNN